MSERKKNKKQKGGVTIEEPSKEELKMAKHVRFKTPKKTTVVQKQNIEYFVGSKAVDTLMASKWAQSSRNDNPAFVSRDDAITFMEKLLASRLFYRAIKVPKLGKEEKKSLKQATVAGEETKARRRKKEKEEKDEKSKEEISESKENEEKSEKKKRRYKLDIHEDQVFLDSSDVYVWVYDPLHPRTLLLGGVVLLGVIAATLFPLWPPEVRIGVYYLSVLGGIFVGSIFAIALVRSCVFGVLYAVTLGNHRFWFLPNLLADVGFFDSFKPLYTYEVGPSDKKKNKHKEKSSDNEEEKEEEEEGANNPGPQGSDDDALEATSPTTDSDAYDDVSDTNRDEDYEILTHLKKKSC